mgnify:FL=1
MQDRAGFRRERRRHDRQSKQRKAKHDGTEIKNGDDDTVRTKYFCKSVKISYPTADEAVTHKVIRVDIPTVKTVGMSIVFLSGLIFLFLYKRTYDVLFTKHFFVNPSFFDKKYRK